MNQTLGKIAALALRVLAFGFIRVFIYHT